MSEKEKKQEYKKEEKIEKFTQHFEFKIAKNSQEMSEVKKLRYEIFIKEMKYGLNSDPLNKTESDRFDKNSIHCLIRHRRTGLTAGYLRLITTDSDKKTGLKVLPIESEYQADFYKDTLKPSSYPLETICEASRLAVSKTFRTPAIYNEMDFTENEKRCFSGIITSLFACSYALAEISQRTNMFAIMEPSLPRLLSLSGFKFKKIGKEITIFGKRNPYHINRELAESGARAEIINLYRSIKEEISPQI
ncbi:MAG: hypothetical protein CME72_08280 [Halomonadaceae bacterium]|nr:hypothetical protein [Halomonadaceae bacterium]